MICWPSCSLTVKCSISTSTLRVLLGTYEGSPHREIALVRFKFFLINTFSRVFWTFSEAVHNFTHRRYGASGAHVGKSLAKYCHISEVSMKLPRKKIHSNRNLNLKTCLPARGNCVVGHIEEAERKSEEKQTYVKPCQPVERQQAAQKGQVLKTSLVSRVQLLYNDKRNPQRKV